ncbi:MAG: GAF domain-containing SpoIIE family protein phosphatase [Bryobacter sp.]|nr:GAF domain-containing SpoIIE family protein phosphatase [Bryobacter sp.]
MQGEHISRVIFEYASRIGGARETGATLKLNADMARDLVGADRCSIWLIDRKASQLWTMVAHGVDELRIPLGHGLVGASVETGETIVSNDAGNDPRLLARASGGYETKSVLVIPLRAGDGTVIGALQALNKPGGFSPEDVNLLGLAASYSASAIEAQRLRLEAEAAKLVMRELEIAQEVQRRLFPESTPQLPALETAAYCRAAKSVGGDYYDFIELAGGGLFFTLGDISGKGMAAAVLMASIQAAIRSQVLHETPQSLAGLMGTFNKAVASFSRSERYSTLFCGQLDPTMRQLTYVNGGQAEPMLLRAATGKIERLNVGGPPVGLLSISLYSQATLTLETGDVLLCYSDGVSEAENEAGDMWEDREVKSILKASAALSAREIQERIVAGADAFAGNAEQSDDLTLVVLKAV